MNILYLTNHLNIGGITSYVLTLAGGLKRKGHNVYIASSGGELVGRFIEEGINYIPMPIMTKQELSPKVLISLSKLLKFVKENNIDIIHSNTRVTQVLGCLISKFSHKPHISTCHGFFKRRFSRRIFPCWGDKVIAVSEQVREYLIGDFGVKEKDVRVICNGIDVERFRTPNLEHRAPKKNDLGLSDGLVVGIIARLSDVKGHVYLIKAMKIVLEQIPDAQLLIVGDGKQKKELMMLVKELGIEESVFFVPSVMDTADILSVMDLFVLPSLKEGLGLSLMEAMAQGLPVIGSNIGGIKSLIRDGFNGLLAKPADINGLSSAILELLKDANKRAYLGTNARDFISRNFSLEQMVSQTEEVYQECINAKD